jgi:hypothetical protein
MAKASLPEGDPKHGERPSWTPEKKAMFRRQMQLRLEAEKKEARQNGDADTLKTESV